MPDPLPKHARLAEFLRRLEQAPRCADLASARSLLDRTLNAVEDELSGVPFNPGSWRTDGRMYPVQDDNVRSVPGYPKIRRLSSLGHVTYVADSGALEIRARDGTVEGARVGKLLFAKPGENGKGVWDD